MHLEVHHAPNLPEKLVNISRIRDERIGSGLVGGSGIENPAHHNDRGSLSRLLSSHPLKEFGGFIILRAVVFCIAVISSQRRFVSCQFNQSSGRSAARRHRMRFQSICFQLLSSITLFSNRPCRSGQQRNKPISPLSRIRQFFTRALALPVPGCTP